MTELETQTNKSEKKKYEIIRTTISLCPECMKHVPAEIIVDPDSINLQRNLSNWCWLDRKGEVPMDEEDDLIDAGRYYTRTIIKPIHTGGVRLL